MIKILDIEISFGRNIISEKIKKYMLEHRKGYITTINSNLIVNAYKKDKYKYILQKSTICICDGSVLTSCLNLINKTNYRPYPGPDFFIDRIKDKKYEHLFLGATKETLNNLKKQLVRFDPRVRNALFIELPFLEVNEFDYKTIGKKINERKPDFIWVSLGAPKQEEFSSLLLNHIDQGLIVPIGAAFDFYSKDSKVKRAPLLLRKLYLEWLYRLYKQPKKTFIRLMNEFFYMPVILLKEIIKKK